MRKGYILLSVIALLVSFAGILIALIAYFKKRNGDEYDDCDDGFAYYDCDDDSCDCCEDEECGCCEEEKCDCKEEACEEPCECEECACEDTCEEEACEEEK